MAITYNINETIHLRDNWNKVVAPAAAGETLTINDTIHLRDVVTHENDDSGGTPVGTLYIQDEIHLRDAITFAITGAGGGSLNINETIHLRDTVARNVEVGGIYNFINEAIHLYDQVLFTVKATYKYIRNENVSFGETKDINYKEFSHRFRWTNYNGVAVPDLNYKDLKEPIVRMMPAPSFLQFEYANSFLLFTRNSINRFILTPDVETGQWRARTDNLIEEFKDLGLMSAKTLILAKDTLFGQSEKGVWMWNKKEMRLISDKIIDLPDAGIYEFIAFYNSIRNQYILHRQESGGGFLVLEAGTPEPPPQYAASTAMSYANAVFLDNTRFALIRFEDSNQHVVHIGEVDVAVNGVTISAGAAIWGYPYISEPLRTSMIVMENGNSVVITADQNLNPKKVIGVITTGATPGGVHTVSTTGGNYAGGVMIKLTEFAFACIITDGGTYEMGTVALGIITLSGSPLATGISFDRMKAVYMGGGITVIAYISYGGNIKVRTVQDNGDGTLLLGSIIDTGMGVSAGEIDFKKASSTLILLAAAATDDLKVVPITLTGTTLSVGTPNTKTGYFDGTNRDLAIVPRGSNGAWLFFEDGRNSSQVTVMWASVSADEIIMNESITTVIQSTKTYSITAIPIVAGGKAIAFHNEDEALTDDGFATVWGLEYANIDSWVYQIDRDKWGKFLGMDILDIPVILSGGSLDENYNLWLDSDRQLMKYPGNAYTAVEAMIRTKEFYIEKGAFQRWMVDFEGTANVETRVKKTVAGVDTNEEDIKYNVTPNKFRGISLDKQRGYQMSIKIIDADIIRAFSFDAKKWGEE